MAKSYVGAPRELTPPPRGNPGFATGKTYTEVTRDLFDSLANFLTNVSNTLQFNAWGLFALEH